MKGWRTDDGTGTAPVVGSDFFMPMGTVEQLTPCSGRAGGLPVPPAFSSRWSHGLAFRGCPWCLGAFLP